MPANDKYQQTVVNALIKDGWIIDKEQVHLNIDHRNLWIDIQASKLNEQRIILIEVKNYLNVASPVSYLQDVIGQYLYYRLALQRLDIHYPLFLAIPNEAWQSLFQEEFTLYIVEELAFKIIVFDSDYEEIILWKT